MNGTAWEQLGASMLHFLPELALAVFLTGALLATRRADSSARLGNRLALAGIIVAFALTLAQLPATENDFLGEWIFTAADHRFGFGMLVIDRFAISFKLLIAAVAAVALIVGPTNGNQGNRYVPTLALGGVLACYLMAEANDLVILFLSVELGALCALPLIRGSGAEGREARVKYALYGAVCSALMLFGIALLYGMAGGTNYLEVLEFIGRPNTEQAPVNLLAISGLLVLAGLLCRIAVVPFHTWFPDFAQKSNVTSITFAGLVPILGGLALLVRFLFTCYPVGLHGFGWGGIVALFGLLTMSVGNLAAMHQGNLKRMLGFATVAHVGFVLVGVAVSTTYSVAASLFWLAISTVALLGAFVAVDAVGRILRSTEIEDFRGVARRAPVVAGALALCMIALAGLVPTVGFVARFFLFGAIVAEGEGHIWLLVACLLNELVMLYYTLRVVGTLYRPMAIEPGRIMFDRQTLIVLVGIATLLVVSLLPNVFAPLWQFSVDSLGTLARLLHDVGAAGIQTQ